MTRLEILIALPELWMLAYGHSIAGKRATVDTLHHATFVQPAGATAPKSGPGDSVEQVLRSLGPAVLQTTNRDQVTDHVLTHYGSFVKQVSSAQDADRMEWNTANDRYLESINYGLLLHTHSFASLTRIDRIRAGLDDTDPRHTVGKDFVLSLADAFMRLYPVTSDNIASRIAIAKAYLAITKDQEFVYGAERHRVDRQDVVDYYNTIGRFLLVGCARVIETGTSGLSKQQRVDAKAYFESHGVYIDEPESDYSKFMHDLGDNAGREHIVNRVRQKFGKYTEYELDDYRLEDNHPALNSRAIDFYHITGSTNGRIGTLLFVDKVPQLERFAYLSRSGGALSISDMLARTGASQLFMYTSGSYVDQAGRTSGLAAEQGVIKNYSLTMKMKGLVVVLPDGRLRTWDLSSVAIPGQSRRLHPLNSLRDFHSLILWLQSSGASCFQTHLLMNGGELAVNPSKEVPQLRERRILATLEGDRVAVIDLPASAGTGFTLYQAAVIAQKVFARLTPRLGTRVEGVVNMDTGAYDIYDVFDDSQTRIGGTTTGRTAAQATNLLILVR